MNVALLAAGVASWVAAILKFRDGRRNPSNPKLKLFGVALALMGTAFFVGVHIVDHLLPPEVLNIRQLVFNPLVLASTWAAQACFLHSALPVDVARGRVRRRGVMLAVTLVAMAIAGAVGLWGRFHNAGALSQDEAARPGVGEYYLLYLAAAGFGVLELARLTWQHARKINSPWTTVGLYVVTAGFGGMFVNVACKSYLAVGARMGFPPRASINNFAIGAIATGGLLIVLGATITWWGKPLHARWQVRRDRRHYRRIEPLWSVLRAEFPEIVLTESGAGQCPRDPAELRFRLARSVIEIRDAYLLLQPWIPTISRSETEAIPAPPASQSRCPATREAQIVMNALRAKASGAPPEPNSIATPFTGHHCFEDEVVWLCQVSDALSLMQPTARTSSPDSRIPHTSDLPPTR